MKYISQREAEARYDELLDECYHDVKVCGYMFTTSTALQKLDPIAYRCGLIDWLDSENLTTDEDEADEEEEEED